MNQNDDIEKNTEAETEEPAQVEVSETTLDEHSSILDAQTEENEEISFSVETDEEVGAPVFGEEVEGEGEDNGQIEFKLEDDSLSGEGAEQVDIQPEAEEGFALPEELTLSGKAEAIIFASPKPLRTVEIHELLMDQGYTLKEIQDALDELSEFYRDRGGGFHLKYIKRMGYQFQTTPAAKSLMEKQFSSRPRPLSRAALETLAVVAYRQKITKGVTRAEVEFIRGVDAGSIFKTLVERNLLTCTGRKEIPGRPMMFGVTDEFLKVFQLGSINDLPPLESFQSPPDVIKAANDKIALFEAEQEGVDPEAFIGDESYTETLGEGEFDILSAEAAPYAPSLERIDEVRADVQSAEADEVAIDSIPADILASMAQEAFAEITEADIAAAAVTEAALAVPADLIEQMVSQTDELDAMVEDEIAFAIPAGSAERAVQGASLAPDDDDWESIGEVPNPEEQEQVLVSHPGDPKEEDLPINLESETNDGPSTEKPG